MRKTLSILIFFSLIYVSFADVASNILYESREYEYANTGVDSIAGASKTGVMKNYTYYKEKDLDLIFFAKKNTEDKETVDFYRISLGYDDKKYTNLNTSFGYEQRIVNAENAKDYSFGYLQSKYNFESGNWSFVPSAAIYRKDHEEEDYSSEFDYMLKKDIGKKLSVFNKFNYHDDMNDQSDYNNYFIAEAGITYKNKIEDIKYKYDLSFGSNRYNSNYGDSEFVKSNLTTHYKYNDKIRFDFDNYTYYTFQEENRVFTSKSIIRGDYILDLSGYDVNKAYVYSSYNDKGILDITRVGLGGQYWFFDMIKFEADIYNKSSTITSVMGTDIFIKYFYNPRTEIFINYNLEQYNDNYIGLDAFRMYSGGIKIVY